MELKTGLVACSKCKNELEGYLGVGLCKAKPIIKFNCYKGEEYIFGYDFCSDINNGNCQLFEQKPLEMKKEKDRKDIMNICKWIQDHCFKKE